MTPEEMTDSIQLGFERARTRRRARKQRGEVPFMEGRKRLIVHIGPSKTGSTSIQMTLRRSRETLVSEGVAYWGMTLDLAPIQDYAWQHVRPPEQLLNRASELRRFPSEFVDCVERSFGEGPDQAIISNDSFAGAKNYQRIIPLLRAVEDRGIGVLVVAYARSPSAYAQSAFAQWELKVKPPHRRRIRSFAESAEHYIRRWALNFEAFDRAFGDRFQIRNYDAADDVVADFLAVVGVDDAEGRIRIARANIRPRPEEELLRTFFNDRQAGGASPADFQAFGGPPRVNLRLDVLSWYRGLLPTQDDVAAATEATADDLDRLNKLLARRGQPLLSDSARLLSGEKIDSDYLVGLLLQIVYAQHLRLSALEGAQRGCLK